MADDNLSAPAGPEVTTPPTYDEQVEDISNLLEDPDPDLPEEPEDDAAADPLDDPDGLDAEDVVEPDADDPDGPDAADIKGGRFAPDNAKVKLDDGTTITIAELKRNNLYQRGFTEKTTALAKERETFESERQQVTEYAQSLATHRDYLAWYAEQHLPKDPGPTFTGAPDDFVGYLNWKRQADEFNAHKDAFAAFQQQKQADDQRKSGETQRQAHERLSRERDALLTAIPTLKDPVKGPALWQALVAGAQQHYGIAAQEVNTVADHRMILALRDALRLKRIEAKAPNAKNEVARKPAMKAGRRAAPNQAQSRERQARSERLRNSGSFNDGVAALQDLDL